MSDASDIEAEAIAAHEPIRRGRRLGRYVLCYELASGGMATVYLGRSEGAAGFEKLVALKIIHPHLAKESEFVEMFLDEARIASRIQHPNVCSVFDFGQADDTYFLAMEYLVGENAFRMLQALVKRRELLSEPRTALLMAYIIQLACEGLHAAHEARGDDGELLEVVHRDMTPQNLFVGFDGSVRVVDFGIASGLGRVHHTTAGMLKGKYSYMSPEQIQQRAIDRRSDVWSLGVTLWEMLTCRRLFRRSNEYETLTAVLEREIPKPSDARPTLDPELDAIVMRALTRDVGERYATAREFGRALGRYVSSAGGATMADVADLMDDLFPEGRATRSRLVDKARRMDPEQPSTSGIVPALMRAGTGTPSSARVDLGARSPEVDAPMHPAASPIANQSAPPDSAPLASVSIDVASMSAHADPDEVPAPRRTWLIGALALASVASLAALTLYFTGAFTADATGRDTDALAAVRPAAVDALVVPGAHDEVRDLPGPEVPPAQVDEADPVSDEDGDAPEGGAADTTAPPASSSSPPHARDRTPTPERAPAGIGSVNVVTPPGWADIYVDGESAGRSPTTIRVSAGSHRIRLVPYGDGRAITRRVRVAAGDTERLVVRLDP